MTRDEDDAGLLQAWRGAAREAPGDLLDRRILKAARDHRQRRRLLPLAAAMAACLVLALAVARLQPVPAPARAVPPVAAIDTSTFGLYEGREFAALAAATAAEPLAAAPAHGGASRR